MSECGSCHLFNEGLFRTSLANKCSYTICDEDVPEDVETYCLVPINEATTGRFRPTPHPSTLPPATLPPATLPPARLESARNVIDRGVKGVVRRIVASLNDTAGQEPDLEESGPEESGSDQSDGGQSGPGPSENGDGSSATLFGIGAGAATTAFVIGALILVWLVMYVLHEILFSFHNKIFSTID